MNLEELSTAELREVLARVDTEIGVRESTRKGTREALMRSWYEAIIEVWYSRAAVRITYPQWKRGPSRGALQHLAEAEKFALRFFSSTPRPIQIHPARVVMVECLHTWMASVSVPMSLGALSKHMGNLAIAVADQFPGYARGGMLPMVLKLRSTREG